MQQDQQEPQIQSPEIKNKKLYRYTEISMVEIHQSTIYIYLYIIIEHQMGGSVFGKQLKCIVVCKVFKLQILDIVDIMVHMRKCIYELLL